MIYVIHFTGGSSFDHAALAIVPPQGGEVVYISAFPGQMVKPYSLHTFEHDCHSYHKIANVIALSSQEEMGWGLSEAKMIAWWEKYNSPFSLLANNCADFVYRALQVGLQGQNIKANYQHYFPVWRASQIIDYAKALKGALYPASIFQLMTSLDGVLAADLSASELLLVIVSKFLYLKTMQFAIDEMQTFEEKLKEVLDGREPTLEVVRESYKCAKEFNKQQQLNEAVAVFLHGLRKWHGSYLKTTTETSDHRLKGLLSNARFASIHPLAYPPGGSRQACDPDLEEQRERSQAAGRMAIRYSYIGMNRG